MDYFSTVDQFKEQCGYTIDGVWYPRVTKIVGIKNKPALLYYYGEAASYAAATAQTKISAEEGTLIHQTMEKIFVGEEPLIDASIAPAVKAARELIAQKGIQIDAANIERRIYDDEHRYAGTIDSLALIGGKFGVLDIKTSQAIYRDYNLQTSAYMYALNKDPILTGLQTRWIFRIDQQKKCYRCGASMRPKGGREKIRGAKWGICPNDNSHEWSPLTGIAELQ
ncbi:MAG: hypothetical protein Q8L24_00480, partial [bacterium]|nr:hypothetical protein [bacterium]